MSVVRYSLILLLFLCSSAFAIDWQTVEVNEANSCNGWSDCNYASDGNYSTTANQIIIDGSYAEIIFDFNQTTDCHSVRFNIYRTNYDYDSYWEIHWWNSSTSQWVQIMWSPAPPYLGLIVNDTWQTIVFPSTVTTTRLTLRIDNEEDDDTMYYIREFLVNKVSSTPASTKKRSRTLWLL